MVAEAPSGAAALAKTRQVGPVAVAETGHQTGRTERTAAARAVTEAVAEAPLRLLTAALALVEEGMAPQDPALRVAQAPVAAGVLEEEAAAVATEEAEAGPVETGH